MPAAGNRNKKLAALDIINVSIKIYFKLNTLRLCKNLIRTVGRELALGMPEEKEGRGCLGNTLGQGRAAAGRLLWGRCLLV